MVMKKRVLFVEDNLVLLQLYEAMVKGNPQWEVAGASGGEDALRLMAQNPVDVLVSDLHMPGMDGVKLIQEVKRLYPQTSRIIISGLRDQKEIARCLSDTHQFMAKPFSVKVLNDTLSRLRGLETYLQDDKLRTLAGRLSTLPSFPSIYLDIMQELATEDPSNERIGEIIAQDPAMTAKMMQIANSAAFGLSQPVHSPFDAVQHVGTSTVRALALSAHVFSAFEKTEFKGFSLPVIWDHAIKTANLSRAFLRHSGADEADVQDAYTAGMLHDLGKMMLAVNVPKQFQEAIEFAREQHLPLHAAEQYVFGATHAGVGAYLLGLWGLPAPIVEAVAFHHAPLQSDSREPGPLTAVHVANVLAHEFSANQETEWPASELDADYLYATGIQEQIEEWRGLAVRLLKSDDD